MSTKAKWGALIAVTAVVLLCLWIAIAVVTYGLVGPTVRCALPRETAARPGWEAHSLISGGIKRCYYLYTPPDRDPAQPLPVVFSFHGFLSNPNSQALISGWHDLADREGFAVVYPQGQKFPLRWNAGPTWGNADVDDVQFFRDMLDDLPPAVDRTRVYVNGFSNGGGMAVRIGCEAADRVAAIGSVSGAVVSLVGCPPDRPLPLIAFHGTADPIVPYEGEEMRGRFLRRAADRTDAPYRFIGVEEWVTRWAEGDGCDPFPRSLPPQGNVFAVRYTGCDAGTEVILYTIIGGGHTWPGGRPIPGMGETNRDINATEEMWRFFQQFRLAENR